MSKFKNVLVAAKQRDVPEEDTPAIPPVTLADAPLPAAGSEPAAKPVGRPKTGKRSSPDYEQVTAYIKKQTYTDVRIALLQDGGTQEFSDLVEELLIRWMQARP